MKFGRLAESSVLRFLWHTQQRYQMRLSFLRHRVLHGEECLRFRCNICGHFSNSPLSIVAQREGKSCHYCGSTLRFRSIIHVLSDRLFGQSLVLPEFPTSALVGVGMSDAGVYARPLSRKLRYKNTYYHKEPRLDITEVDSSLNGSLDFVISSDVFEHVPPPVEVSFRNLYSILKPGGVCVFSVPFKRQGETEEHFPHLHDFKLVREGGKLELVNRTRDGIEQRFQDLVFHGGPGSTLEMRLFSMSSLIREIAKVGFVDILVHEHDRPEFGIIWKTKYSMPISMRRPEGSEDRTAVAEPRERPNGRGATA